MSLVVKLSYEEKILNALGRVQHKRKDDCITRSTREFEAIRPILQPLYDELRDARREVEDRDKTIYGLNCRVQEIGREVERLREMLRETPCGMCRTTHVGANPRTCGLCAAFVGDPRFDRAPPADAGKGGEA
jgi:hypothetical protein